MTRVLIDGPGRRWIRGGYNELEAGVPDILRDVGFRRRVERRHSCNPSATVVCGGPQGHCYRRVGIATCTQYSWETVSNYALGSSYQGWPGHLLTVESSAEWQAGFGSNDCYIGALGPSNGPYSWAVGPSAGTPVTYFGTFVAGSGGCAPFSALETNNTVYYAASPTNAGTRACNSGSVLRG